MIDILAALDATTPHKTTTDRCGLGKWLDTIPDDAPGKARLEAFLTETNPKSPHWRTLEQLDAILRRLGKATSNKTIGNHRMGRCRCVL